jgi:hypothetical protein
LAKWKTDFEAAQDRAQQSFTMNTRWCTVALAFVAAFALQLDAFDVYNRISSDDALRNGLVNLSTAVQKRADEAMNVFSPGTVYFSVLQQMKATKDPDVENFDPPEEKDVQTYSDATKWLHKQADGRQFDGKRRSSMIDRFHTAVQKASKSRLDAAEEEFGNIAGLYGESRLQLIPDPYLRGWDHFFEVRHLVGMLAAALLLTLKQFK